VTQQHMPQIHFIDTNVWLYALIKGQDSTKSQRARSVITTQTTSIAVSTQVINELCVNLIKRERFTAEQIRNVIIDYYARYTVIELNQATLVKATYLRETYTLSYWNSLIVASALASGASTLQSEDMHDGLIVEQQLTIVNPFK
jgi:predicted nucleic acid-binding protein